MLPHTLGRFHTSAQSTHHPTSLPLSKFLTSLLIKLCLLCLRGLMQAAALRLVRALLAASYMVDPSTERAADVAEARRLITRITEHCVLQPDAECRCVGCMLMSGNACVAVSGRVTWAVDLNALALAKYQMSCCA